MRAWRSRRACSASTRSATSARTSSATWGASTRTTRRPSRPRASTPTTAAPTTSAGAAWKAPTSASCTAPPASSRSRSTPPAAASARLQTTAAQAGNNVVLTLDMRLQRVAENAFGERRGALVAIEPGTGAVLALRLQARLRPEPVRRRHRPAELGGAQQLARPAAQQPRHRRRLSAGLDLQAVHGARRARDGQAHAAQHDQRPGLLHLRRPALPRFQARRPRRGRPAQVDRGLLRHVLLPARERHGHRRDRRRS